MKFYKQEEVDIVTYCLEILIMVKTHFGVFFTYFRCGLKESSDFKAKNVIRRTTITNEKNNKNFPKN